jgi:hypothetical protein
VAAGLWGRQNPARKFKNVCEVKRLPSDSHNYKDNNKVVGLATVRKVVLVG